MLRVGIDEAGYGPNLGPLVMSAVVAEGPDGRVLDVWGDLASTVSRAGGPADRTWVDDSKRIYKGRRGRERLDSATLAVLGAVDRPSPATLGGLVGALGSGTLDDVELSTWLDGVDPAFPPEASRTLAARTLASRPFAGAPWRLVDVRSVVVGPGRFNAELATAGSKAVVHFSAFARLLRHVWGSAPAGGSIEVRSDKHGGRHFYAGPLGSAFPGARVVTIVEGAELSRYELIGPDRRMGLELLPRADADDGLVALASIVSKTAREGWMDAFNAHWLAKVPGLRPTAGYPVDAARFRLAIEGECARRGLAPSAWWRAR